MIIYLHIRLLPPKLIQIIIIEGLSVLHERERYDNFVIAEFLSLITVRCQETLHKSFCQELIDCEYGYFELNPYRLFVLA